MSSANMIEELFREVDLFIQYGVRDVEQATARFLLERYGKDALALQVMKAFYSSLPDTCEEAVIRIAFVRKQEDVFLLAVSTNTHAYLYLATVNKALLLGEYGHEGLDPEPFVFFGFEVTDGASVPLLPLATLEEYEPVSSPGSRFCPVCSAAEGEWHLLGCPVEVCPWCEGQLSRCGCRFEQMGVEEFVEEGEIERFERLLQEKGRVPYDRAQRPSSFIGLEEQEEQSE